MNYQNSVDILLVEDNPRDTELTIRAINKHNSSSRIIALEDSTQALDYIFCKGKYANREITNHPKVILKGCYDSIPAPCMIHSAVHKQQVRFFGVPPVPEMQLQPIRIIKL